MEKKNKKVYIHFCFHLLLLVGLIWFDQYTKILAVEHLKDKESYVFIENILSFSYVENRGAAWGVLSGKLNILMIITLILMPIFIYLYVSLYRAKRYIPNKSKALTFMMYVMVLLLSGAIGNFIDRLKNGYVVDFLEATFIDFPVFNMADCYIVVGEIIFVIVVFFVLNEKDFEIVIRGKKAVKDESVDG